MNKHSVAKRLLFLSLLFFIAFFAFPSINISAAGTAQRINTLLDGKRLNLSVSPIIKGNIVFVPAKDVFRAFGLETEWIPSSSALEARTKTKKGNVIRYLHVQTGKTSASTSLHGPSTRLEAPPFLYGKTLMVPLSFIGTALEVDTTWNRSNRTIKIQSRPFLLNASGYIVRKTGGTSDSKGMAFLELRDYGDECGFLVALGEDNFLYAVSKQTLVYRKISESAGYAGLDSFQPLFCNNRVYFTDTVRSLERIIKNTDGNRETGYSGLDSGLLRIGSRLFFINTHGNDFSSGLKYIDMDSEKEFRITDKKYTRLLYVSKKIVLYETYLDHLSASEIHLYDLEQSSDDNLLSYTKDSISLEGIVYRSPNGNSNEDPGRDPNGNSEKISVYASPAFLTETEYGYVFFDTDLGIFLFRPQEKSFRKLSDQIADSTCYSNKKLYIVRDSEIGSIGMDTGVYTKLFVKKELLGGNYCSIDSVDKEGNVFFTVHEPVGMEHYDRYQYRYLVKRNVIELLKYDPGRIEEPGHKKIGQIWKADN